MQSALLRIGTRRSPLALAQSREVVLRLAEAHGWDDHAVETVPIRTKGDAIVDQPLADFGGKGLFTLEIEEALKDGRIDLAVHSAKDMPTLLPPGLAIVATPSREDVRDAFLSPVAQTIQELPEGAVLGTSSLRRKALALMLRPDLKVVEFRGNVATRLRKLGEGLADATLLAAAGLNRLGLAQEATSLLETDSLMPAVGQGAIAIEARADNDRTRELLAPINHPATLAAIMAERAFLAALDGSCRTPIGGLAETDGDRIDFRGIIVTQDGKQSHRVERAGAVSDAEAMGRDAGDELARRGGPDFFREA